MGPAAVRMGPPGLDLNGALAAGGVHQPRAAAAGTVARDPFGAVQLLAREWILLI